MESNGNIVIKAIYKNRKEDIEYIKMIKELYDKGKIEEVLFGEDIPDKDKTIISAMVDEINRASIRKKVRVPKE